MNGTLTASGGGPDDVGAMGSSIRRWAVALAFGALVLGVAFAVAYAMLLLGWWTLFPPAT